MGAPAAPLAGRSIVITRPAHQAGPLAEKVRCAGGHAILFPVIEIADVEDLQPFYALVDRLEAFDIAIFISPNAVSRTMDFLSPRRTLPPRLAIAAIGDATVKTLRGRGVAPVIAPAHGFDSEALLAQPALQQVAGKRVVIFRGQGGRELLGEALAARGAHVEYAECYRRTVPALDPAPIYDAWQQHRLDGFVVTSSEGVKNLFQIVGTTARSRLVATPLFVPHSRIAETARRCGVAVVVTTGPGDDGILAGVCAHFSTEK